MEHGKPVGLQIAIAPTTGYAYISEKEYYFKTKYI